MTLEQLRACVLSTNYRGLADSGQIKRPPAPGKTDGHALKPLLVYHITERLYTIDKRPGRSLYGF